MKRNWKIIRAILLQEDVSEWPEIVVNHHRVIMTEAGWLNARIMSTTPARGYQTAVPNEGLFLTPRGQELAEMLTNAQDLDEVLRYLDEKNVGHHPDFVMELMQRKTRARLLLF